ncbi:helix-turn-helix domain-containing protein [Streptomyces sp. NPDC056231]|uniref:helix-turn-helix domain-containing protein n=1 Tax=Streptomyces sp. NPDC056231 TaxID=3345755 RepID=UPI003AAA4D5C
MAARARQDHRPGYATRRRGRARCLRSRACRLPGTSRRHARTAHVRADHELPGRPRRGVGQGGPPPGRPSCLDRRDRGHRASATSREPRPRVPHQLRADSGSLAGGNGRPKAAAARLHIHPNTLRHRMRRLRDVVELQLDSPDVRSALLLQLMALRYGTKSGARTREDHQA